MLTVKTRLAFAFRGRDWGVIVERWWVLTTYYLLAEKEMAKSVNEHLSKPRGNGLRLILGR